MADEAAAPAATRCGFVALIGAVFSDGGYVPAAALIERYWQDRMLKPQRPLRDPKTVLQEWVQGRGMPAPVYREIARSGPDHDPHSSPSLDHQMFSHGSRVVSPLL